jgi:signal transduction histidine kinase
MNKTRTTIILPFLFAIALGCILFFQFNSYKSIKQLIGSNEELLTRIKYENQFQRLQTHLATFDKLVREAVITRGAVDEKDIRREIQLIDSTINYIDDKQPYDDVNELSQMLDSLVSVKITNGIEILNEFADSGKQKAELMVYDHNKRNTNDVILKTIKDLENLSEQKVEARVNEIDRNEKKAIWANILIAIGACLFLLLALIYIFYKITQQQSLIQELNLLKEKEEKSSKIKDDFLANMSHEIRTPLNAIVGFTKLLEKEHLVGKAAKFVTTIKTSGEHLMDITNEILDIAKLEAGMIFIEQVPFDLQKLIIHIEHSFKERIEERQILFEIDNLATHIRIIKGDEFRLTQILNNLLGNALKFTVLGKITLQIRCSKTSSNACTLVFLVTDTGIGIAKEKMSTIFDRFEQGDPQITRKYGGTGLGLAIVKQLVELQHGNITIESELDKGSSFKIEIPFELPAESSVIPVEVFTEQPIELANSVRVLIVEDNRINQQLLEHWFKTKKINYSIAQNGFEALDILGKDSFDLILMDIQMPEMDGYEVTIRIRNEYNNTIPIIAMTAHAMDAEKEKCIASGMNDYLSKPISELELFKMLANYSAQAPKNSLIDLAYLDELSNGRLQFRQELLQQFIRQAPDELSSLHEAYQQQDEQRMKALSHSMKTTFGYLGISNIHLQMLDRIEKAHSVSEADPWIKEVAKLCKQVEADCHRLLQMMEVKS